MSLRQIDISCTLDEFQYSQDTVQHLFHLLDENQKFEIPEGELSIVFLSGAELCDLHEEFLQDASPTDVITFEGDTEMDFAGEICVSIDQALMESSKRNCSLSDELILYLVHGWLHLAGLDDLTLEAAKKMRNGEEQVLSYLKEKDLQIEFFYNK